MDFITPSVPGASPVLSVTELTDIGVLTVAGIKQAVQRGAARLHAFRYLYLGDLLRLHRLLYLPSDRFLDRHRAGLFENALPPAHWAGRLWSSSGAIAELERSLIIERVRVGMRRARLEGRPIRRKALVLDRAAIHRDRQQAYSLGQLAKAHLVSRTTIHRVLGERIPAVTEGLQKTAAKTQQNHGRISTIRPFRKVWVVKQGHGCY